MVSQGYRDWLNAGRPYALIRPAKAVQATLRGYGLTVYDYPNDAHLKANTPEDHTPFSVTGWPGSNRRWNARALDVMPRSGSAAHRKENADIARQLIRDRDAGHPGAMWIKYLNWTNESGVCLQERWTDAGAPLRRTTRSSSDKGHIHISGRSDVDNDARADGYDPVARMRNGITGGSSMGYNDAEKARAAFDLKPKAVLDTDGTDNGSGNLREFDNPLYLTIKAMQDRINALEAAVAAGGGAGVPVVIDIDTVTAEVAQAAEELAVAEIVKRLDG